MHLVYATRLRVQPAADERAVAFFSRLAGLIGRWIEERATHDGYVIEEIEPGSTPRAWVPGDAEWRILDDQQQPTGQINRWAIGSTAEHAEDQLKAGQWEISHPLATARLTGQTPLHLCTYIQARQETEGVGLAEQQHVVVVLRQFIDTHERGSRPRADTFEPPSLVRKLVEQFSVFSGGIEQKLSYWSIEQHNVDILAREIENPARELPIIVISRAPTGQPLVDPGCIGRALLGAAKVAVLDSPRTATDLGHQLRGTFLCFNGAVRAYDVGFTHHDERDRHRWWRPKDVSDGEQVALSIRRHIISASVLRIGPDQTVTDLSRDRLQRGIAESLARESEHKEWAQQFEELSRSYNDQVEQLRADLDTRTAELKTERTANFNLRAYLTELEGAVGGASIDAEVIDDAPPTHAASLHEAVLIAQEEADPVSIEFLPSALDSAKKVRFDEPTAALRDLRALCNIAEAYHNNRLNGTSFKEAFKARGLHYDAKVSESAKGQHPNDYTRHWECDGERREITLDPHFSLTKRHRVYWYLAERQRKFVVGHVGDHLHDSTTG